MHPPVLSVYAAVSNRPLDDQGPREHHRSSRLTSPLTIFILSTPVLFFGVTGHQGNHGEDVKELYYYLDSTPTHSYMKYLYKYPQRPFPYEELVNQNVARGRDVPEFELIDTGIFDDNRYWDVFVEVSRTYAF